jgi:hypothetical protein
MKIKNLRFCFLILSIIPCLFISCIHSNKKEIESIQTPKEQFLSSIVDLGGLIGENQNLILNVLDKYKIYNSPRIQNSNVEQDKVKVIKVIFKKQKEYFWFVDDALTEIHIPVGSKKVLEAFSSNSSVDDIKKMLGKPSSEYNSKTDPEILNLMFNSENFSLNFVLSNKDLDEKITFSKIMDTPKKIINSGLKEIRLTPSYKKPMFIGFLEKSIYQSNSNASELEGQ